MILLSIENTELFSSMTSSREDVGTIGATRMYSAMEDGIHVPALTSFRLCRQRSRCLLLYMSLAK